MRNHRRRVSSLQTWTYKAQNRQDVSAFALTYSLRLRSCKSMDAFCHLVLAFPIEGDVTNRRAHWDRMGAPRRRLGGVRSLLFRLQDRVTFPPWRTFPDAPPTKPGRSDFLSPGSKPWPIFRGPSQGLGRLKRWFDAPPPLLFCPQPRLLKPSSAKLPVLSSRPPRRPRRLLSA